MLRHDPGLAASPPMRYILKWGGERYSPRCARTIEESTDTDQSTEQQRLDPSPRRLLSASAWKFLIRGLWTCEPNTLPGAGFGAWRNGYPLNRIAAALEAEHRRLVPCVRKCLELPTIG
jgi:hypothetical protein